MPLVADGVLYYTGSYSRVFALNGATSQVIWSYFPELDDALVARQTHSPYNRGVALGRGKVFVGTVDGRLIALDMKTGKVVWDTKLRIRRSSQWVSPVHRSTPKVLWSSVARAASGLAGGQSMGSMPKPAR